MRFLSSALACAALLAGAAACRPGTPTYHRDIAPIFARSCRGCHRPDGVAPVPSLGDYATAKSYAQPIALAVQARRMPPWGADDTGLCGSWQGARWLTAEEISAISRWQQSGAPEGEPQEDPAPLAVATPFRSDATLDAGGLYRPGLGAGGYRCFVADPKLSSDRLLSAIRVAASDARGVAQVTLFALDSAAAESEAAALDAADPAPGYSCYGTARVRDARLVSSWTWPDPILRMPAGSGVKLGAGRKMVVQIHYNIAQPGAAFQTTTRVDLELDDGVREATVLAVDATGSLAPGKRYVAVENSRVVERRMRVVGIAPRMHIHGQVLHLTVEHRGNSQKSCLGDFDHWHFYDQQLFRSAQPLVIEPNDRIHISCAYNTLGRSEPIAFGEAADQEECVAYLFVD